MEREPATERQSNREREVVPRLHNRQAQNKKYDYIPTIPCKFLRRFLFGLGGD